MLSLMCQGRLDFLSHEQKLTLDKHFSKPGANAMPHQIAGKLGISYSEALAILAILEADGLCEMKLLIYHQCEPDLVVDAMPYGKGFPQLPWKCPNCEEEAEDYRELSFDFMAIAPQVIKFT